MLDFYFKKYPSIFEENPLPEHVQEPAQPSALGRLGAYLSENTRYLTDKALYEQFQSYNKSA